MDNDSMWFFDELPEDFKAFRNEARALENEYLELRRLLWAAETDLKAEPENENLQAKVRYLQKRIKGLEEKAPWLTTELAKEYALWGVPH